VVEPCIGTDGSCPDNETFGTRLTVQLIFSMQPFPPGSVVDNAGPDKQGFHGQNALQKRRAPAKLIAKRHDPVENNMINAVSCAADIHVPFLVALVRGSAATGC
jgi:hypothetical protein